MIRPISKFAFLGWLSFVAASSFGVQASTSTTVRLHALFDEAWQFSLDENPLFATAIGDYRGNDRLPSATIEDQQRRADFYRQMLERLQAIPREELSAEERINYDMFRRQLSTSVSDVEFRDYLFPFNADSGFHIGLSRLPAPMPFNSVQDYENYISRLNAIEIYIQQHLVLLREALDTGMTQPRVILEGYEATIDAHVVADPKRSVFYAPFETFPTAIPPSEHRRLREEGLRAITDSAIAGYRAFSEFFKKEYRPRARETIGASELPNGRAYYAYLVGRFTTLDLTADDVHQIGLRESARIRKEMDTVIDEVDFDGDFEAFLDFLRTDPRFYPKSPEELLKEASFIAKKMDGMLPRLFKTLPRQPYTIEPVPAHIAPKYTAGRYVGAPLKGTRAGAYWVNTYALESRPLYAMEALTLHEAVPGHHLQNALRQELDGLPDFRRYSGVGAYGEGWGLYSERLGLEVGFYEDPYSNFGRLTYEMWRACRLVVDTGLHAKGWTRKQAIDYLAANTALSLHEITTEIDRYIGWPGQALGYKMGELKIRELRALAEDKLGAKFDLRDFHDVILLNGPVPLPVLENLVADYIASAGAR